MDLLLHNLTHKTNIFAHGTIHMFLGMKTGSTAAAPWIGPAGTDFVLPCSVFRRCVVAAAAAIVGVTVVGYCCYCHDFYCHCCCYCY